MSINNSLVQDTVLDLLKSSKGLFIGERHGEYAHPELVCDLAPKLSKIGVQAFYFEIIPSSENWRLENWNNSDPRAINEWLELQTMTFADLMWEKYQKMLVSLHKQNIRIIGIDDRRLSRGDETNAYWASIIEKDQELSPCRFICYGGRAHMRYDYDGEYSKPIQDYLNISAIFLDRGQEQKISQLEDGRVTAKLPAHPDQGPISELLYHRNRNNLEFSL